MVSLIIKKGNEAQAKREGGAGDNHVLPF
jgi:hypothetical protein